jgi:SPP1 gp7 family putative phage head morphogenesis protein
MAEVPIRTVITLPPEDTVRAFDAREELRTTVKWSEMLHGEHSRAFTVAKVAKLDLLEDIRTSLADVIHNGGTFEQWQANLVPTLEKAGWWGRVEDRELTGTSQPVFVGPRRLRTIYDTNLRMSRAAGQWARIQESKARSPYLRYSAVMDTRTRPLHRQWHGTILPVDHEWWDTHFPPCGWNCRCTVQQLSDRDLRNMGWSVSKAPPPSGPGKPFWPAGASKPVLVPAGIDPGFDYNPGKTSMAPIAAKAVRSLERAAAQDVGAARAVLRDLVDSPAFLKALDEPGTAFPVAILSGDDQARLSAPAKVVVLPSGVYEKQRRPGRHAELAIADYRQLPQLIHDALVVIEQGADRLLYFRDGAGRLLKAVVRMDADQPNAAVVSFHIAGDREITREAKKGTLILDRRAGS